MKIFKCFFLIFCLSASLCAADWTGSTSEPESTKKIDGKVFYVITSAEELAWFAAQVNSGKTTINAQLANDILFGKDTSSITSTVWTMIGKSSSARFAGVFDGQGYVVYGLYFGNRETEGFFGYVAKEGVVKNLTLVSADASEKKRSGGVVRGGIAAVNYGMIQNCVNKVVRLASVIQGTSGSSYVGYVGGLVGKNYGGITKSQNFANISLLDLVWPGIAYAAGIAAYNEGTISESSNSGAVYTKVARMNYVGGIVSHNASSGKIAVSYNSGVVTSFYDRTYSGYNPGANNGGIAGLNSGLIENVYNVGKDSSYENIGAVYTGGIVGVNTGASAVVKNAYVAVTRIYAKGSSSYSGGVAGANNGSAQIINAYYDGSILAGVVAVGQQSATVTDVESKTTDLMKTDGFVRILNTANETEAFSGVWGRKGGYPVFIDSTEIYFSIRFFDSDTTLLDSQYVQYGRMPSYSGTPTKASTAQFSYAFEGWHVEPTAATEDFDYYAVYSETLRSYTVRFLDYDGTELQNSTYLYGAMPGISKVPARASTVAYDYAFSGWTPAVEAVTGDAIYTALYDSSKVKYTVTFMDGSSVFATVQVPYGEAAVAPGTPSREGYKFVGWNGSLSNVTGDVTVSALFEELVYREVVIDRGDDGRDTVRVEEDEWFTLPDAPEKPGHTFTGWYGPDGDYLGKAGDTVKVSADMRIEPRYEANLYRIAFVNGSDTLQGGEAAYGTLPSYSGSTPTKASSAKFTYAFNGWTPAIDTVKGPATYTAIFDSTEIPLSSSSEASSSSDKSCSSAASSGSSAKSSSSSAGKNSSSSSEPSDAIMANLPSPAWSVTASGWNFQVHAAPVGKPYALFDLQGKVLAKGRIESSEMTISAPRAGSYIVRIGNSSVRMNAK